jgi:GNAT superfamily N-acetyltransferase
VNIRPAVLEDARPIAEILCELEQERTGVETSISQLEKCIETALEYYVASDSHQAFVAEVNGEVLGYLAIQWLLPLFNPQLEGYVSDLFVRASNRGQGTGGQLLERIVLEARARGCRRLTLVNVRDRESYTRAFYPKQGWVEQDAARFVLKL